MQTSWEDPEPVNDPVLVAVLIVLGAPTALFTLLRAVDVELKNRVKHK